MKTKIKALGSAIDIKYMGAEPTWTETPVTDSQLADAYNWYTYVCSHDDVKSFTLSYFKTHGTGKALLSAINDLPSHLFITVGSICRMIERGAILPERTLTFLKDKCKIIVEVAIALKAEKDAENKLASAQKNNVISIQDRIAEQVSNLIAEIEEQVDDMFEQAGEPEMVFGTYNFLQTKNVKGPQAKMIAEHYQRLSDELAEVLGGKDEQLKEGYRNYSKVQIKKIKAFVDSIITDCGQIAVNAKASRRPRARKAKSAEQVTAKVKYMKNDPNLKVTSVNPAEIIRATQVWVYNTKYRKLGVYHSASQGGLNIKGTTILDFDEKASIQKKLRKPEQVIPNVTQGGKVALRTIMASINAKTQPLTGRINEDTLILKVIK